MEYFYLSNVTVFVFLSNVAVFVFQSNVISAKCNWSEFVHPKIYKSEIYALIKSTDNVIRILNFSKKYTIKDGDEKNNTKKYINKNFYFYIMNKFIFNFNGTVIYTE